MIRMRSFLQCYRLGDDGRLAVVSSSIAEADDMRAALGDAGYVRQLSSELVDGNGAEVVVWSTTSEAQPAFFIEIMGAEYGLGCIVADDFPHFLATLQHLRGLIELVALDQRSDLHADAVARRHV
jgi:hypothetical protein